MSKKNLPPADSGVDSGMNGLEAFFTPGPARPAAEPAKAAKAAKKTALTHKEGLYFSEVVSDHLDQLWKQQPRNRQKSKSWLVETLLRAQWGLPALEE
jgi:hypothetical protein